MRLLYIFIDGIGFGKSNPDSNPFSKFASNSLISLGGGINTVPGMYISEIDAHQGIKGLPQSATGQTSLWTGINGSKMMGHHKTGFPGPTLIDVIQKHSIIRKFRDNGLLATLINAYSQKYIERLEKHPRFKSASTQVQLAAGLALKNLQDLAQGNALYMDLTHEIMHNFYPHLKQSFPLKTARQAGIDLVRMLKDYDLLIYEYFLSDKAGHKRDWRMAKWIIENLEQFIAGITSRLNPAEDLLLISSDHGNLENLDTKTHTHNPVPLIAFGKYADLFHSQCKTLTDIPNLIYKTWGISPEFDKKYQPY